MQALGLGTEFHPPNNTVPVSLSLICYTMRVLPYPHVVDAIIDKHRDGIPRSQLDIVGHIEKMRSGKRIVATHLLTIHIDCSLNMRTLQIEGDMPFLPRLRHIDATPVPCPTYIVFLWRQEERELHVSFLTILLHIGIKIIAGVVERARPAGVHRNREALVIGLHRTRQQHIVLIFC